MTTKDTPSDTTIDKILGIVLKDYGTKTLKLIDVNEAKSALYDLILKEIIVGSKIDWVKAQPDFKFDPSPETFMRLWNACAEKQINKLKGLFDE